MKNEDTESENIYAEIQIDDSDELPRVIINTDLPNDLPNQNSLTGNVPLFIKKLWKMVNDNSEEIIVWNVNGDSFVIQEQLKFISHTLPKYFKHNHLSSFVRQLNLYDFHKIQNVEKEEFQFSHPFFLRDVPQLLALIKRKSSAGRQKASTTNISEPSTEVQEIMNTVKDIKTKSDLTSNELSKLRQENAALWGEMNSLRVKYSKQTKIINKLIHFLISYMQKHHNPRKSGRNVSTNNANKYLKTGPKIMELDYRYKNNPHEFWTEFDNQLSNNQQSEQEAYTVVEPAESNTDIESQTHSSGNNSPSMTISSAIEELLPGSSAFNQASGSSINHTLSQVDCANSQPPSSKRSKSALQRAGGSKDNLGYFIDNTQIELNTLKGLLKNLTPDEMTNFYKLVNDNYKNQDEDVNLEISPETEGIQNELMALAQMSPLHNIVEEQEPLEISENVQDIAFETNENIQDFSTALETNDNVQNLSSPFELNENLETDTDAFNIPQDELLNPDDLLTNLSVDQFFN